MIGAFFLKFENNFRTKSLGYENYANISLNIFDCLHFHAPVFWRDIYQTNRLKIYEFVSKKYLVKTQVHEIKNSLFCGSTSLVVLKVLKETLER